ncbi:unnamed protein product [Prorocentrum cordatum]|uniref:Thioredoxin domain-containing protein n=1 Tax=Prorocentrum cordatum TaxID=2364126 RepID=A0ABN9UNF0_9DINO|nr:unnamed protein product [Polarella glacialis]
MPAEAGALHYTQRELTDAIHTPWTLAQDWATPSPQRSIVPSPPSAAPQRRAALGRTAAPRARGRRAPRADMVFVEELPEDDGEDEGDGGAGLGFGPERLWACPRCGDQVPQRRRGAHEALWCSALNADGGDASSGESSSDAGAAAKRAGDRRQGSAPEGLRARRAGRAGLQGGLNFERRCPHGFHPQGCAQCAAGADTGCCGGGAASSGCCDAPGGGPDELAETSEGARRRARLSFFFLVLFVLPGCGALFLLAQEMLDPGVRRVAADDAGTVKDIFFGGKPWVVYCVNKRTGASTQHLPMLAKAAEILRPEGIKVAEVHCWNPLPTKRGPRTLAKRFRFQDRPPVSLFVAGDGKPQVLDSLAGSTGPGLARQAVAAAGAARGPRRSPAAARGGRSGRGERVGRRPRDEEDPPDEPGAPAGTAEAEDGAAAARRTTGQRWSTWTPERAAPAPTACARGLHPQTPDVMINSMARPPPKRRQRHSARLRGRLRVWRASGSVRPRAGGWMVDPRRPLRAVAGLSISARLARASKNKGKSG